MVGLSNLLGHISVTEKDMERSLDFYRDLLRLKEIETHQLEGETIMVMEAVLLEPLEAPEIELDLEQSLRAGGKKSAALLGDVH